MARKCAAEKELSSKTKIITIRAPVAGHYVREIETFGVYTVVSSVSVIRNRRENKRTKNKVGYLLRVEHLTGYCVTL